MTFAFLVYIYTRVYPHPTQADENKEREDPKQSRSAQPLHIAQRHAAASASAPKSYDPPAPLIPPLESDLRHPPFDTGGKWQAGGSSGGRVIGSEGGHDDSGSTEGSGVVVACLVRDHVFALCFDL